MTDDNARNSEEINSYLARIRKTIADSQNLVLQAELRIAETDRMLERQGLTREQVMQMRFSDAQLDAVNEELKRRGLDPLEKWAMAGGEDHGKGGAFDAESGAPDASRVSRLTPNDSSADAELENRQRKFGMMMKPFQI